MPVRNIYPIILETMASLVDTNQRVDITTLQRFLNDILSYNIIYICHIKSRFFFLTLTIDEMSIGCLIWVVIVYGITFPGGVGGWKDAHYQSSKEKDVVTIVIGGPSEQKIKWNINYKSPIGEKR